MKTAKTTNYFSRNLNFVHALGLGYRVVEDEGFNRVSLLDVNNNLIGIDSLKITRDFLGAYYFSSPARARAFSIHLHISAVDQIDVCIWNGIKNYNMNTTELIGMDMLLDVLEERALAHFELDGLERIPCDKRGIRVRGSIDIKFFDIYQHSVERWYARLNNTVVMSGTYTDDNVYSAISNDEGAYNLRQVDTLTPLETEIKRIAKSIALKREELAPIPELDVAHELLDAALSKDYHSMLIADICSFEQVQCDDLEKLMSKEHVFIYGVYPIYAPGNTFPQYVTLKGRGDLSHAAFTTDNWILVPRMAMHETGGRRIRGYVESLLHAVKCMGK